MAPQAVLKISVIYCGTLSFRISSVSVAEEAIRDWVEYMASQPTGSWHIRSVKGINVMMRMDLISAMWVGTEEEDPIKELHKIQLERVRDEDDLIRGD